MERRTSRSARDRGSIGCRAREGPRHDPRASTGSAGAPVAAAWLPRAAAPALLAALALAAPQAGAGGFFVQEQSVRGEGRAFAGSVAVADDASTLFFNPAGMTELGGARLQAGSFAIFGRASLEDDGTDAETLQSRLGLEPPTKIHGGRGGNPFGTVLVPSLYAAMPVALDGRLWAGLAITSPFGIEVDYEDSWFGRYDSTDSRLRLFDFQPSLAFAITDRVSVGAGLDIQYASAQLENRLPVTLQPQTDGRLEVTGDDWSVGWTVGVLWEPLDSTRLGASYRWGITHELKGSATFAGLTGVLAPINRNVPGSADLDLPGIVMVGFAHELTPAITLLGQVDWFQWSRFEEIRVDLDEDVQGLGELVTPQEYENSVSVAVGGEVEVTDALTLRSGVQWDQSPTGEFRSTRVPDSDRTWLTLGASLELGHGLALDASYAHVFLKDAEIDVERTFYADSPAEVTARTRAEVESAIDIVGLQLRASF